MSAADVLQPASSEPPQQTQEAIPQEESHLIRILNRIDRVPTRDEGIYILLTNALVGAGCGALFGIGRARPELPKHIPVVQTTVETPQTSALERGSKRSIGINPQLTRPPRDWAIAKQKAIHFAPRFAAFTTGFAAVDLAMCYSRGKRDIWNRTVAGAVTGAVGGYLHSGRGGVIPFTVALGACGAIYDQYYLLLAEIAKIAKRKYDQPRASPSPPSPN